MRLCGVDGCQRVRRSHQVLTRADSFQVNWVAAGPVAAEVIEMMAGRDWSDQSFEYDSVNVSAVPQLPISARRSFASPQPAIADNLDAIGKPIQFRDAHRLRLLRVSPS
jgi:hypothetical protein